MTISKLAREIEGYKRELKEKDNAYTKLEEKLNAAQDDKIREKELNSKETELNNTKNVKFYFNLQTYSDFNLTYFFKKDSKIY